MSEVQKLWQSACRLASERVAAERLALHSARVEMQDSQRELMKLADTLTGQIEELSEQLEVAQADKAAAEARALEAEASVNVTMQMMKEFGIKAHDRSKVSKQRELPEGDVS